MESFQAFLNNPLYVSLFVILLSALVGFYVNSRVRDRCLRDFDGYTVTIEHKTGKMTWGVLRTYSTGLEVVYSTGHRDPEGHVEYSYILYDNETSTLQAIYRFHDHQTAQHARRREHDIARTYQPSIVSRARRSLRNLFNTFKDAIVQASNAILGQRAAQRPQNLVLSRYQDLTSSGVQLVSGTLGNAYEPILERHIGQYVVAELLRGEAIEEEYGILKEYSPKYVELLNAKVEVPLAVYLQRTEGQASDEVPVAPIGDAIRVTNPLPRTLLVQAVRRGKAAREVEVAVEPQQTVEVALTEEERGETIELEIGVRCLADLVVPRAVAAIRHAGKREALTLDVLLGLDDLPQLPWVRRLLGERERRMPPL
ncbi:MAG: hypothetical protein JXA09_11140 [Anaerolineae bacterium]|nr:hypothetical protein [Anaerolineae bacterium]